MSVTDWADRYLIDFRVNPHSPRAEILFSSKVKIHIRVPNGRPAHLLWRLYCNLTYTSFILHINIYHRSLNTLFLLSCKKINFIYNWLSIVVNVKKIYDQFRLNRVCFDHRDDGQNTRILVKAVLSWIISFLTPSDSQILQETGNERQSLSPRSKETAR